MFKKLVSAFLGALLLLSMATPTLAVSATPPGQLRKTIMQDVREELKASISALKESILARFANLSGATVASVGTNTITVSKDGKTYTVNILATARLRRRFWGSAALTEISVGDTVNVWGSWTDSSQTTINAKLIRDVSIQKRNGVFIGEITSVSTSGWVMKTAARGDQTVTVSNSTRFSDRKGTTIAQSDIVVGHRVRVRGMWDRKLSTISEVSAVKDYSLPAVAPKKISSPSANLQ